MSLTPPSPPSGVAELQIALSQIPTKRIAGTKRGLSRQVTVILGKVCVVDKADIEQAERMKIGLRNFAREGRLEEECKVLINWIHSGGQFNYGIGVVLENLLSRRIALGISTKLDIMDFIDDALQENAIRLFENRRKCRISVSNFRNPLSVGEIPLMDKTMLQLSASRLSSHAQTTRRNFAALEEYAEGFQKIKGSSFDEDARLFLYDLNQENEPGKQWPKCYHLSRVIYRIDGASACLCEPQGSDRFWLNFNVDVMSINFDIEGEIQILELIYENIKSFGLRNDALVIQMSGPIASFKGKTSKKSRTNDYALELLWQRNLLPASGPLAMRTILQQFNVSQSNGANITLKKCSVSLSRSQERHSAKTPVDQVSADIDPASKGELLVDTSDESREEIADVIITRGRPRTVETRNAPSDVDLKKRKAADSHNDITETNRTSSSETPRLDEHLIKNQTPRGHPRADLGHQNDSASKFEDLHLGIYSAKINGADNGAATNSAALTRKQKTVAFVTINEQVEVSNPSKKAVEEDVSIEHPERIEELRTNHLEPRETRKGNSTQSYVQNNVDAFDMDTVFENVEDEEPQTAPKDAKKVGKTKAPEKPKGKRGRPRKNQAAANKEDIEQGECNMAEEAGTGRKAGRLGMMRGRNAAKPAEKSAKDQNSKTAKVHKPPVSDDDGESSAEMIAKPIKHSTKSSTDKKKSIEEPSKIPSRPRRNSRSVNYDDSRFDELENLSNGIGGIREVTESKGNGKGKSSAMSVGNQISRSPSLDDHDDMNEVSVAEQDVKQSKDAAKVVSKEKSATAKAAKSDPWPLEETDPVTASRTPGATKSSKDKANDTSLRRPGTARHREAETIHHEEFEAIPSAKQTPAATKLAKGEKPANSKFNETESVQREPDLAFGERDGGEKPSESVQVSKHTPKLDKLVKLTSAMSTSMHPPRVQGDNLEAKYNHKAPSSRKGKETVRSASKVLTAEKYFSKVTEMLAREHSGEDGGNKAHEDYSDDEIIPSTLKETPPRKHLRTHSMQSSTRQPKLSAAFESGQGGRQGQQGQNPKDSEESRKSGKASSRDIHSGNPYQRTPKLDGSGKKGVSFKEADARLLSSKFAALEREREDGMSDGNNVEKTLWGKKEGERSRVPSPLRRLAEPGVTKSDGQRSEARPKDNRGVKRGVDWDALLAEVNVNAQIEERDEAFSDKAEQEFSDRGEGGDFDLQMKSKSKQELQARNYFEESKSESPGNPMASMETFNDQLMSSSPQQPTQGQTFDSSQSDDSRNAVLLRKRSHDMIASPGGLSDANVSVQSSVAKKARSEAYSVDYAVEERRIPSVNNNGNSNVMRKSVSILREHRAIHTEWIVDPDEEEDKTGFGNSLALIFGTIRQKMLECVKDVERHWTEQADSVGTNIVESFTDSLNERTKIMRQFVEIRKRQQNPPAAFPAPLNACTSILSELQGMVLDFDLGDAEDVQG
ncbi:hypothetical protein HDU76_001394 [Blyttiomyces sp. JEL0837]|nr:hypothetical protein HDU76_001394 [Blyttiomyces sp. JEL0837]